MLDQDENNDGDDGDTAEETKGESNVHDESNAIDDDDYE